MNILDEIVAQKKKEVASNKELYPTKLLEKSTYFTGQTVSLKKYIQRSDKQGIIAEIKRKSPSHGILNKYVNIEELSIGYMQAGASALSILTDQNYFGGKNEDLSTARKFNFCPILRKDFTLDEYQIIEAKSIGADAILLIACILSTEQIKEFTKQAHSLGLEVLLEVHSAEELEKSYFDQIDLVGVNNRNLNTLKTDLNVSKELAEKLPKSVVKVAESGISKAESIKELKKFGYNGFLIGEAFMKSSSPQAACAQLVNELNKA